MSHMHPIRVRFSLITSCLFLVAACSPAWGQTKNSQNHGARGFLRNFASSILNNSGGGAFGSSGLGRPIRPFGANRPIILSSPSYLYTSEPTNLHSSLGAYDFARTTQVNAPPPLASYLNPTPGPITPVNELPTTALTFGTIQRPMAGANAVGTAAAIPVASARPVRNSSGFFTEQGIDTESHARELGIAIGRGEMAFEQGRYAEARSEFVRASTLSGDDATVDLNIALTDFAMGQFAESARSIREALALSPDVGLTYRLRSRYGNPNDLKSQQARLETHVAAHPDDADAWLVLTLVRWYEGDAAGATTALDRYEQLRSDDEETKSFRAILRRFASRVVSAGPAAQR